MTDTITIEGTIKLIGDTQEFGSGFTKREIVVTTDDPKYPQDIKMEMLKDKCAVLDGYAVGQEVICAINIKGNEHNGRHYVNLTCWRIDSARKPHAPQAPQAQPGTMQQAVDDGDDCIPF